MKRIGRGVLIVIAVCLAAYIVWDRVEAYRLSRTIAALAARGEPVDAASFDPGSPKNDAEQEAARLYIEAIDRATELLRQDGRLTQIDFDSVVRPHLTPEQVGEIVRPDAAALQLIDRAASLPFTGFGDLTPDGYFENQSPFQVLSGLPSLRADLFSLQGDGEAAARSLIVALRSMRTIRSPWYRSHAGSRVFGSLRILLRHTAPSATALEKLQQAFDELPDEDGLPNAVRESRARFIESINERSYYGVGSMLATALHPVMTRQSRRQIDQYDLVLSAVQKPWPAKIQILRQLAASDVYVSGRSRVTVRSILRHGLPNMALMMTDYGAGGLNLVRRRAGITVSAIERYRRAHSGMPPATLDALVPSYLAAIPGDPFSGRPLIYKVSSDAYTVYSVDTNLKDDGGAVYGHGSMESTAASMRPARDYGIRVPLEPGLKSRPAPKRH